MTLFKVVQRGLGLVSMTILARLLIPADFGLVALAATIVAAFELLTAFNFEIVLIQNRFADRTHYDTAWTFNVVIGVSIALVVAIVSDSAAEFFHEPRLAAVLLVLAVAFAIKSFTNIAVVDFQKDLRFVEDFKLRAMQSIARFAVTIPLAFWLRSYWALLFGILAGSIIKVFLSYWVAPYRPSLTLTALREMIRFSSWLLANSILVFLRNRATELFLGRIAGLQALGLFAIGFEISNLPTSELVAPINRAVMPGYARMADKLERLRDSYVEVVSMIAMLAFPAGVGIAVTAHLIVPVLLGEKWLAAIPVIQILAFYGSLNALFANSSALFNALARPHIITIIQVASILLLIPLAIYMMERQGAVGLALAYLGIIPISMGLTLFFALKLLDLRLARLVHELWRPIVATGAMYLAISAIFPKDESTSIAVFPPVISMALAIILGILIFAFTVLMLWHLCGRPAGAEQIILTNVKRWVRKRF